MLFCVCACACVCVKQNIFPCFVVIVIVNFTMFLIVFNIFFVFLLYFCCYCIRFCINLLFVECHEFIVLFLLIEIGGKCYYVKSSVQTHSSACEVKKFTSFLEAKLTCRHDSITFDKIHHPISWQSYESTPQSEVSFVWKHWAVTSWQSNGRTLHGRLNCQISLQYNNFT